MNTNPNSKMRPAFFSVLAILCFFATRVQATQEFSTGTFTWDNMNTPAWSLVTGGSYNLDWTNNNDAIFEGAAGTVSVASAGVAVGNLTFNANGYLITNNTLTLTNAISVISDGSGQTNTIGSVLAGTNVLYKMGVGTVNLTGSNTFAGGINVSNGVLGVANWGAGNVGQINVAYGANTAVLNITGDILNPANKPLQVGNSAAAGQVGIVNQSGGTVAFTTGSTALLVGQSGSASLGSASYTYNLSGGTLTNKFSSTSFGVLLGVNKNNNCTFNLSGSGNLAMLLGALQVGRADSASTNCAVVYNQSGGTAAVGTLTIGGGSGSTTTAATFIVTNGTFVATNFTTLVGAANSSAAITLGGAAQVTLPAFPAPTGTVNLTLDFTGGYLSPLAASASYLSGLTHVYLTANGANFNVASGNNVTIGQVLANAPSQVGVLTKTGAGTLTLTNANTFTGSTVVSAGKLVVSSAQTSATGAASVADGATLGVTTSGSSQWSPASLTLGNGTGCTLEFNNIANPGTSAAPLNAGSVTRNGAVMVNINSIGGSLVKGGSGYPLVANVGGTTNGYSLGIQSAGVIGHLAISGSTLTYVADTICDLWNAASPGGSWDVGITADWTGNAANNSPVDTYLNSDAVLFNDSVLGPQTVTLGATVTPAAVNVVNNSTSYTISSSSGSVIGGSGTLGKSGSGTLTLVGPNTYSGGTTLSAGQLNINFGGSSSANSAIGTGSLTILGGTIDNTSGGDVTLLPNNSQNWNGDFTYAGSANNLNLGTGAVTPSGNRQVTVATNTLTVGGLIGGGAVALTKLGAGTLTLSGSNSYTGSTTISAGTISISAINIGGVAGNLGAANADATNLVFNGGTLEYNGTTSVSDRGFSINAGKTAVIQVDGTSLTLGGATGASTSGALNKTGNGTLVLSGANNYTGNTIVYTGELDYTSPNTNSLGPVLVGATGSMVGTLGITAGTLNFGASSLSAGSVANNSIGVINQSGGAVNFTNGSTAGAAGVLLGNGFARSGTYNLSGGTLTANSSTNRGVILGVNEGGTGVFNLSGTGNLNLGTSALMVGRSDINAIDAYSTYNQTGGNATVGYLTIGGGGSNVTGQVIANFSITAGSLSATNFVAFVGNASSSATIDLGGSAQVTFPAFPAPIGSATLTLDFTNGYLSSVAPSTNFMSGLANVYLTTNGANFNIASGNDITVGQPLQDTPGQAGGQLAKTGSGVLTLSGANTYTGNTTNMAGELIVNGSLGSGPVVVTGGTLSGAGTINGSVTVNAGATVTAGALPGSIGTLTINSNLAINGNLLAKLNKSQAQSNDVFTVSGALSHGGVGSLTVTNLGPALAVGDRFKLFNKAVTGGASFTIVPPVGYAFANNLAVDGSITVQTLSSPSPVLVYNNLGGGSLQFSWTGGYKLQSQTNSLSTGLTTNWYDYPGGATSPVNVTVDPTKGSVFFRLSQ